MLDNHTFAREVAVGGFAQKVALPSNPSSNQLAVKHSAVHSAVVFLSFGVAAYTIALPKNAILKNFSVFETTAFAGGTSPAVKAGTSAGAADLMAAHTFNDASASTVSLKAINSSADGQTVYVSITGGPTSGAGYLLIDYINQ